jgi:hypothetical protein
MKNIERALVATGVALVLSGGIASAAILSNSAAAVAAQPGANAQLAAMIGGGVPGLADNGGRGGADLMTAAATYIGIPTADLRTQLAAGKSLTEIATANGKTRDGLIAALVAEEQKSLGAFVDQKGMAGPGGFGGPGRPGGPAFGRGFDVQGDPLTAAATFLGTTPADLRTKLQGGQTLAAIATASGKTRDALIQALVNDAKTAIEKAKTDGKITADRATSLEAGLTVHITQLVDSTRPGPGPRR